MNESSNQKQDSERDFENFDYRLSKNIKGNNFAKRLLIKSEENHSNGILFKIFLFLVLTYVLFFQYQMIIQGTKGYPATFIMTIQVILFSFLFLRTPVNDADLKTLFVYKDDKGYKSSIRIKSLIWFIAVLGFYSLEYYSIGKDNYRTESLKELFILFDSNLNVKKLSGEIFVYYLMLCSVILAFISTKTNSFKHYKIFTYIANKFNKSELTTFLFFIIFLTLCIFWLYFITVDDLGSVSTGIITKSLIYIFLYVLLCLLINTTNFLYYKTIYILAKFLDVTRKIDGHL